MRKLFKQHTIAMVYDFDGTLSPQPMQEYTVLPELGVSPQAFWDECQREAKKYNADAMLTYMRLLTEKIEAKQTHLNKKKLRDLAKGIRYFPGVETWFDRINRHVRETSAGKIKIKHYIISAGLKEILEGIKIRKYFERMYASEYYFDHHDAARFPTVVINDTSKTQYIFRINKGIEDINQSINDYMPECERPIPFENMLYIGDGLTDVPCMTVTKNNGGFALAVYKPRNPQSLAVCRKLARANRIDYFAPADYRAGKTLEKRVKLILDVIMARIMFHREQFTFQRGIDRP
ncbi:MAG: haloacid dehalogenase-like hydrolase [Desulfobacteraceae bacterium]|nr:haloacid dehalogenase-like hydrolase [Desulfobacteraceae bacterium]MBC2749318.1 haloacid dehalogenase-like hydrolase [Desulfobacteraceae bacterium]